MISFLKYWIHFSNIILREFRYKCSLTFCPSANIFFYSDWWIIWMDIGVLVAVFFCQSTSLQILSKGPLTLFQLWIYPRRHHYRSLGWNPPSLTCPRVTSFLAQKKIIWSWEWSGDWQIHVAIILIAFYSYFFKKRLRGK